jgi:acetyl esterase
MLLYFHGGGYVIGNLDISDAICRSIASGSRCVVISVDYRLAPEHPFPAATDDAWAALIWVVGHATEINAESTRIAVGGDSAGGNIAAAMALKARDAGVRLSAQVLLYASTEYPDPDSPSSRMFANGPLLRAADSIFYWNKYLADPSHRCDPMAAPARAANHENLAPALVVSAECDPSRDLSERYAKILGLAGTPVTARRYDGMPHGFFAFIGQVAVVRVAMEEICEWLSQQWKQ